MITRTLEELLRNSTSALPFCESTHCVSENCQSKIQIEYNILMKHITNADKVLPRHKPGIQKSWWTDELTSLQHMSINIHHLWNAEGKPGSVPTNVERLRVKTQYKKAIKRSDVLNNFVGIDFTILSVQKTLHSFGNRGDKSTGKTNVIYIRLSTASPTKRKLPSRSLTISRKCLNPTMQKKWNL